MSHPSRVCGLKCVAERGDRPGEGSHPSRVCGLKFPIVTYRGCLPMSHPSRVCGLKWPPRPVAPRPRPVTPFTGVWIEIGILRRCMPERPSHPSRVCGLKFPSPKFQDQAVGASHPSRVCGLKLFWSALLAVVNCHTLHGCVD
mgnify:CR=1 FL=1